MKRTHPHSSVTLSGGRILVGVFVMLMGLMPAAADSVYARPEESSRVEDSTTVMNEIMAHPESSIPGPILQRACCIIIIPNMFKLGFIIGGRTGRGILAVKDVQGTWSNPVFVTLRGTSIGIQSGVMLRDVILVFRKNSSLESLSAQNFLFGADASIIAGPFTFQVDENTDLGLTSEIFSYSRGIGIFVGIALQGASLEIDLKKTSAYYGTSVLSIQDILSGRIPLPPKDARAFKETLESYSRRRP
ncbi:MAG: lipid-binding SYLF domain-containing protein [Desulfomonilia bacterium]